MMTEKDKLFLEKLKHLMSTNEMWVELKPGEPSTMVLKGTYGQKVHEAFGVTRQGIRWRFQHLFGQAYVQAFETILFIEKTFGTQLRDYALHISKERYRLHEKSTQNRAHPLVPKTSNECEDHT